MSGFIFGGPYGPKFELFLKIIVYKDLILLRPIAYWISYLFLKFAL